MTIKYTYEIVNVDAAAKCMEVVYSAEGHQTLHIGTRLPYVGEDLEQLINSYSPVSYWIEQTLEVVSPIVGIKGTVAPEAVMIVQSVQDTAVLTVDEVNL
jgi:hypothetical protein